jgi:hypothetical protein
VYRLGDYIEGVTLLAGFLQKLGRRIPTRKKRHPHFGVLCLQLNRQVNAVHAGEMYINDCELRNLFFRFEQRESRFSRLNRSSFISLHRKYDRKSLCDDILIVNDQDSRLTSGSRHVFTEGKSCFATDLDAGFYRARCLIRPM